jgi:GT2 family glycosyltransferase/glycosyltransferase involved in cell wall biosynthesis
VPESRRGVVSIVIVNYRGGDDTIACVQSLGELDWPADRLEVLVVDNASGDGSADRIRAKVGDRAVVIESPKNTGFAGGCNLGVATATGEYVGFLNNDARPDGAWVSAAVEVLERDHSIGAVASKVLDWDGRKIDYVDGSLTWFGMGYKREVERPDSPEYDMAKDVLFATGAAMFVRTGLFREVGGFDERFFMFYEDVDLGWRLNLLGHRVRYVPGSLAFHKHHVTMNKFGAFREAYLHERNALLSMVKNYDDETLARVLPAAMALSVRRSVARSGTDATSLDLQRSPGGDDVDDVTVPKMSLTGAYAIDYLVDQMPGIWEERRRLQAARRRSDRDLMPLFRQAMEPAYALPTYLEAHRDLVDAFGIEEWFSARRRVVVVTGEPLKPAMAGPAIRAWEMAKALSVEHEVTLVTLSPVCQVSHPQFTVTSAGARAMRSLERWGDIIIFQGLLLEIYPWLKKSNKVVVADIYDPFHLEVLEQAKDEGEKLRAKAAKDTTLALNEQLRRGDFFLCASDKQRDFWLGQLAAVDRINPLTYDQDETLASLIVPVPFGVPDEVPVHTRQVLKGVVPGIGDDDKVILWGGGVYNWFDPLTLIRAVQQLHARHPDVRLFFLGMKHPNPDVPDMRMAWETRQLSDALGLTDKVVFFNETWVRYEDRQNYLLEADLGVSTHLDHIETAFSFRTRILDYLWAGLPVVATEGDALGEAIDAHGLGATVPPGDAAALEVALETFLFDEERIGLARAAVSAYAPTLTWSRSLEPLLRFCRSPQRAPDLVDALGEADAGGRAFLAGSRPSLREDWAKAKLFFSEGGLRHVLRKASGRVRRVLGERRTP